jgi:hypothetical protein
VSDFAAAVFFEHRKTALRFTKYGLTLWTTAIHYLLAGAERNRCVAGVQVEAGGAATPTFGSATKLGLLTSFKLDLDHHLVGAAVAAVRFNFAGSGPSGSK